MATYTPTRLAGLGAQLGTSATAVYTVPSSTSAVFNNTSASAVAVTAYILPVGASAGAPNAIISGLSIAPHSQVIWSADIPVATGEKLSLLAGSSGAISYLVSGIEIV